MNVVTLTDDNFENEVTTSEKPVLVDYWAAWCGPCKMVGPIVEEIAIEYSDKLKVGKLDIDSNQESAAKQNVMSIPTLAIVQNGDEITINADLNQINLNISDQEITSRSKEWTCPKNTIEKGVLGKYRTLVSSASKGAVTS